MKAREFCVGAGRFVADPRVGRTFFWCSVFVFLVLAGIGWPQANRSRQIVRKHYGDDEEWGRAGPVEGVLYWRGRLTHHVSMPAAEVKGPSGQPPRLGVAVPFSRWGYVLNISTRKVKGAPPLMEVLVNGALIGSFQVRKHHPDARKTKDCHEIMIPAARLKRDGESHLVIRNAAGGGWQGRLLLIKYGSWRPAIMFLLPVTACCVLIGSLFFSGKWWRVARSLLVFAVFFLVYYYTGFSKKMAPIGGFLMDDSGSFVRYIMANAMMPDMKKHMLFMPVMYGMWRAMMPLFGEVELYAMAAAFAFVAAANTTVAYLWLRRRLGGDLAGMLTALLYGFSFSVWMFSSLIESYILSSLLANLFMLALLWGNGKRKMAGYVLQLLLVVLAGLAHPPLLILLGLMVVKLLLGPDRVLVKVILPVGFAVFVVAGFLGGQGLIRNCYKVSKEPSFRRETDYVGSVIEKYGTDNNLTLKNAGNVLLGQYAYAVGGLPYGHQWYQGWGGVMGYFRTPAGPVFLLGLTALWFCALFGIVRSRRALYRSLLVLGLVVGPYLCFFWYFNPGEMVLYSAPLVSLTLCRLVESGGQESGSRRAWLAGVMLLFTVVLNVSVLTTYC